MSSLKIYTLGTERVEYQGQMLKFRSKKSLALLVYLALSPTQTHSREKLADLLWANSVDDRARSSLRTCLSDIRKQLGEQATCLQATGGGISLQLDPAIWWVDSATLFNTHLPREASLNPAQKEALTAEVALYQGEFLDSFSRLNSPPFEEWRLIQQEVLSAAGFR